MSDVSRSVKPNMLVFNNVCMSTCQKKKKKPKTQVEDNMLDSQQSVDGKRAK